MFVALLAAAAWAPRPQIPYVLSFGADEVAAFKLKNEHRRSGSAAPSDHWHDPFTSKCSEGDVNITAASVPNIGNAAFCSPTCESIPDGPCPGLANLTGPFPPLCAPSAHPRNSVPPTPAPRPLTRTPHSCGIKNDDGSFNCLALCDLPGSPEPLPANCPAGMRCQQ